MSAPGSLFAFLRPLRRQPRQRLFCWCGLEFTGRGRDSRLTRHMRTHGKDWDC